jgi:hypothetical protein
VLIAMTRDAADFGAAVFAELPIGDDIRSDFAMAIHTLTRRSLRVNRDNQEKYGAENKQNARSRGRQRGSMHVRLLKTRIVVEGGGPWL